MYKSSNNKQVTLDNVNLKEKINEMKGLAIMLEQDDGTYKESSTNTFPTDMKFNSVLSGCIDNLGNKIENSLTYENGIANVETSNTSYCYLYFDGPTDTEKLIENVNSDVLWKSTLEDDGYRFVGTDPANYVCFGYSNATTDCDFTNTTNTDLYAYRIIGIFEDSFGKQHLKLIKKEALNSLYVWTADDEKDIDWNKSDLYKGLNGSYFLNNITYSYMQDINWTNKIAIWDYTATNTKTYESSGMDYYSSVIRQTYLHEMNRRTKSSSVGVWDTVSSKIGLMYVSDYQLSLGSTALDYTNSTSTHYKLMKTGWMHISNNDSGASNQYEWTMSRPGPGGGYYRAWYVDSDGYVDGHEVYHTNSVRPVFYLTSDVKISGEGTIANPYIIG